MPNLLDLLLEDSPAKTSRSPMATHVRAWVESEQGFGLKCSELSGRFVQHGLLERMSPVYYPAIEDVISESSSLAWQNSGMVSPTGCLTLRSSESTNDAEECSLSDILEPDAPQKYSLSPERCQKFLDRADENGIPIPPELRQALLNGASRGTTDE